MDNILIKWKTYGSLYDELVIDSHMHLGAIAGFYSGAEDHERVFSKMDECGVKMGLVSCIRTAERTREANTFINGLVEKYPLRLRGMIFINPNDPYDICEEFRYCVDTGHFSGVKIHPELHGTSPGDERYLPIYKLAGEYNYPVLVHTWCIEDVMPFYKLSQSFPDTKFILAHAGGISKTAFLQSMQLAGSYPNIFLDTALSWAPFGSLAQMVCSAGSKKILFGSDVNWHSIEIALGRVVFAKISDDEKRDILGRTAADLYRIF